MYLTLIDTSDTYSPWIKDEDLIYAVSAMYGSGQRAPQPLYVKQRIEKRRLRCGAGPGVSRDPQIQLLLQIASAHGPDQRSRTKMQDPRIVDL